MARPVVLPCDTDALIQLFLSKNIKPLQVLTNYGIQPVIVPEVEIELASNRKYSHRIQSDVRKSIASGLLRVLDKTTLATVLGGPAAAASASATLTAIHTLGAQYQRYVDLGEAYTHSAAITLGTPSLSHDITALRALTNAGLATPDPVLRLFDLVALCYQTGDLSAGDCDLIRQTLSGESEWLPLAFKNTSFAGGIHKFCPRILDGTRATIGQALPSITGPFSSRLLV